MVTKDIKTAFIEDAFSSDINAMLTNNYFVLRNGNTVNVEDYTCIYMYSVGDDPKEKHILS